MNALKVLAVTILAGGLSIGAALFGQHWLDNHPWLNLGGPRAPAPIATLPDFRLPDPNGREISSSSWAGHVLVLNYWATWCPSCRDGLRALARLPATHGIGTARVVAIAIDDPDSVTAFLAEQPLDYQVLIGGSEAIDLSRRLGNRTLGLPFTVIFDALGRPVFNHAGALTETELQAALAPLLPAASAQPPAPL